VHEKGRRLAFATPGVAPSHEGHQTGGQVLPLGREAVVVAKWALLVWDLAQNSGVYQLRQPVGEEVASNAEIGLQLAESPNASEDVAQYQQGPSVADKIQRSLDRASAGVGFPH
jgi:hypothetical protein